jgi:predicted nucleic acid-binding protein
VTAFVLDNSVTMRWCFENTPNPYAENIPQPLSSGEVALAPVLWRYEVGAVLAKAKRNGTIASQKVADFLTAIRSFDITIGREGTERVLTEVYRLAVTYRLTDYDAVYLELALRMNLPLATLDQELAQACLAAGGTVF